MTLKEKLRRQAEAVREAGRQDRLDPSMALSLAELVLEYLNRLYVKEHPEKFKQM
ncbi:MAG: hypothetical protein HYW07_09605 [Candidatus Latescibacteria bacterium]|nr:hypothetical protein [Candidatus Latescibacterota bacterium]